MFVTRQFCFVFPVWLDFTFAERKPGKDYNIKLITGLGLVLSSPGRFHGRTPRGAGVIASRGVNLEA